MCRGRSWRRVREVCRGRSWRRVGEVCRGWSWRRVGEVDVGVIHTCSVFPLPVKLFPFVLSWTNDRTQSSSLQWLL